MQPIFLMNMMFESLVRSGGPQLVLEKWNTEVAEFRKNALIALQHLLENDLVRFILNYFFYS
jgi:hypothetical protein